MDFSVPKLDQDWGAVAADSLAHGAGKIVPVRPDQSNKSIDIDDDSFTFGAVDPDSFGVDF